MTCRIQQRLAFDAGRQRETSPQAIAFVRGRCPCHSCGAYRALRGDDLSVKLPGELRGPVKRAAKAAGVSVTRFIAVAVATALREPVPAARTVGHRAGKPLTEEHKRAIGDGRRRTVVQVRRAR